jgi:tRNA threonylcarbamoyladenosine biosynthesis protein TsaB
VRILALELSSARGSLAWWDDNVVVARNWPNDRKNSGTFFENLANSRRQFGLPDKIIVGLGPGSYAGTRIAVSAAIGLQAVSSAELMGYPSICAVESEAKEYCVIGDARRNSFFVARIHAHRMVEGPDLCSDAELRSKLDKIKGRMPIFAWEELLRFGPVELRYPSAAVLAKLCSNGDREFARPPLQPLYLREPYITKAKTLK